MVPEANSANVKGLVPYQQHSLTTRQSIYTKKSAKQKIVTKIPLEVKKQMISEHFLKGEIHLIIEILKIH